MTFGDDIQRWVSRTSSSLLTYQEGVQSAAINLLAEELAQVLPAHTPVLSGLLRSGYTFRIEDNRLIVSNDRFYALAVKRHGHDLVSTIEREAERIIATPGFLAKVQARALL